jgi:hypothetical protein
VTSLRTGGRMEGEVFCTCAVIAVIMSDRVYVVLYNDSTSLMPAADDRIGGGGCCTAYWVVPGTPGGQNRR